MFDLAASAVVGALTGLIISSLGSVFSSSTAAMVVTVGLVTAVGTWAGGLEGTLTAAWCGVLIVNFAALIGGSSTGFVVTMLVCAALGAWFDWLVGAPERRQGGGRFRRYALRPLGMKRLSTGDFARLPARRRLHSPLARTS
jgi:hypothetical protein